MPWFKKGRTQSRSIGSAAPQPPSGASNDDVCWLPIGDNLYLTKTRGGRQAFGRNKAKRLLQDFGFDVLGQSFGIPSRADYERRPGRQSAASQSSGFITTDSMPSPSRQIYEIYDDTKSDETCSKERSANSSTTTLPFAVTRYKNQGASPSHHQAPSMASPSFCPPFMEPRAVGRPPILPPSPPPPPPPPTFTMGWSNNMANASVTPLPANYYGGAYHPTHLPSYPYNRATMFEGNMYPGYQNHHMHMSRPQTVAFPVLPPHQQFPHTLPVHFPHTQAMPTFYPASIPPPPPALPQEWLHACANSRKQEEPLHKEEGAEEKPDQAVKESPRDRNQSGPPKQSHEKVKTNKNIRQLSKRIRHVHVCAGCGKKRSLRYHKEHPLKRGEVPPLNYCDRCVEYAEDTDCDSSAGDRVGRASHRKDRKDTGIAGASSDEDHIISDDADYLQSLRRGRLAAKNAKKSGRFRDLSKLFTRKSHASDHSLLLPCYESSAEQARSRAPSPISNRYAARSANRASEFSTLNESTGNVIRDSKAAILPQRDSDDEYPWGKKHDMSPLSGGKRFIPTDKENEIRTTSNKQAPGQPRSRVPRPRSQPRPASTDANGMTHVFDGWLGLDVDEMVEITPVSQPARVETLPGSSNSATPNAEPRPVQLASTKVSVDQGVKKHGLSAFERCESIEPPSKAPGRHKQILKDKPSTMPVATGSTIQRLTDDDSSNFLLDPQGLPSHTPEHPETLPQFSNSTGGGRQRLSVDIMDLPVESEVDFNWEPLTPVDVPHSSDTYSPHVMSDSWSNCVHVELEREVEEMAERDLACAGKLFDNLSSTLGGSATSAAFPGSSYIGSNMSIVSVNSDPDDFDGSIVTPNASDSESDENEMMPEKLTKSIEFSSERELRKKTSKLNSPNTELALTSRIEHRGSSRTIKPPRRNNMSKNTKMNLYNKLDGAQDEYFSDNDTVAYDSSPISSSLLGHTGHSTDELVRSNPPSPDRVADSRRSTGFYQLHQKTFPTLFD